MKKNIFVIFVLLLTVAFTSCSEERIDYNNPDVKLFVKQLKDGNYKTKGPEGFVEVPRFIRKDIPELLKYADDLTIIPSFPLPPVSTYFGTKVRLGECMLWIVESIRLGQYASLGCNMVRADADNYEGIYFLSDEEVHDAAKRYRYWWDNARYPKTRWSVDPCFDDPLCGSGYRWW
ncbi:DUF4943 family protein [uncultured Bacteroides sp.]|uniref:DUF4943 family protein n=1 Tax=uncultured Bacteroides sp. TaxID=162156 RepID=UPI002AAB9CDD|nr:DUF4943 family protein [uncultured Bacteroides sp.]